MGWSENWIYSFGLIILCDRGGERKWGVLLKCIMGLLYIMNFFLIGYMCIILIYMFIDNG